MEAAGAVNLICTVADWSIDVVKTNREFQDGSEPEGSERKYAYVAMGRK